MQYGRRGREERVDFRRVLSAGFREVRPAAATAADNGRELLHEASGLHARSEVLRDRDDQRHLALDVGGEHDHAAAEAIAKRVREAAPSELPAAPPRCCPTTTSPSPVNIGEVRADGQFDVVWKTPTLVPGDARSNYLPGSKDLEADWVTLKCGNYNKVTKKCGGT